MSAQKEAYKANLGDNWIRRNRAALNEDKDDPVESLFNLFAPGVIKRVVEVGCANGWRLKKLKEKGYDVYGIDPSKEGIMEARESIEPTNLVIGTADDMPWDDGYFDCVIMGFCMWAMPPEDWFGAVAESDRILKEGGALIIHDRFSARAIRRPYTEPGVPEGMYQYTYDWKKLWMAHPAYIDRAEALGVYPGSISVEGACLLVKDTKNRILKGVS